MSSNFEHEENNLQQCSNVDKRKFPWTPPTAPQKIVLQSGAAGAPESAFPSQPDQQFFQVS